ncbi:MAG: diguanylate cyclase, partial [Deltaproteobacteria bacterium]|nr:diguanylate cyclase [Deltaproteobacteria bacterium]
MKSDSTKDGSNNLDQKDTLYYSSEAHNRALVVDDDPSTCEIIKKTLTSVGYEIDTALTASEALDLFSLKDYDVVISDWKMPKMDGIELINRLKQQSPFLGAILMTGYGTEESVIDAFTRGMISYYLSKPFELEELLETVSAAVRERKLMLSTRAFRERMEKEIIQATEELERKNILLQDKHAEAENLFKKLQVHQGEIQETKEYLENLIESSVDAIISTNKDYEINLFSLGAEEMFGGKAKDYLGRPVETLFMRGQKELNRILKPLRDEKRVTNYEAEARTAHSSHFFAGISASRLRHKGEKQGLLFIIKNITEQKRLEEELRASNLILERLSITDGLTQLFNHRHFQERLAGEFDRALRFETPLGLIMLDLDNFKQVNDTCGHQIGDKVLAQTAELIRQSIRNVDIPARYGGEEFAIILPQTNLSDSVQAAERIKGSLEHFPWSQDIARGISITASVGLAGFPESGAESAMNLIRHSDQALNRAKQIGKNRIVIGREEGFEAIGGGERLTQSEKHAILRRVSQTLRTTLNLEEVLDYFLQETTVALGESQSRLPCSIILTDENLQLKSQAAINMNKKRKADFEFSTQKVIEAGKYQIFPDKKNHGPTSSFPIIIATPEGLEEVVGVINIGMMPPDLDFIQDLVNHAALGIKNAKLYREMELSKAALEKKVNELTFLSLMGMTLQRNAQTMKHFEVENRKLITRCVAQIGFKKVICFDYDEKSKVLSAGVDSSFHGEVQQKIISLSGLNKKSPLGKALAKLKDYRNIPILSLTTDKEINPRDREVFEALGITSGETAIAPIVKKDGIKGLIFAVKETILPEDMESLSIFVLHASLIMDNLNLSAMYQDKTYRLSLLHEMGIKLSTAITHEARQKMAQQTLERMIEVLQADEISIYSYLPETQTLKLMAFTSATADPDQQPVQEISVDKSKVMGRVIKKTLESDRSEPVVIPNIKTYLKARPKKRYATNSYMGVPLVMGGRLLGVMNVTDKQNRTGFTQDDEDLARTSAGMLGSALYNHYLLYRLQNQALEAFYQLIQGRESLEGDARAGHSARVATLAL